MKRPLTILISVIAISGLACAAIYYFANATLSRIPEDELWRITEFGNIHDPTISDDYLLFQTYNQKDCLCVYTVDKLTGEIVWSTEDLAAPFIEEYKKEFPDSTRVPGIVELYDTDDDEGIVYIILNSTLYALDSSNGNVLWGPMKISEKGGYVEYLYVEHSNNVIYVLSDNGNLLALDNGTGTEIWKRRVLGEETFSAYIKLHESNIYVISETSGIQMNLAFDAIDGDFLWMTEINPRYGGKYYSGDTLLAGTGGGGWPDFMLPVAVYELSEGTRVWDTLFEEKGNDDVFPYIAEDHLFLVIDKHNNGEERPSRLIVMDTNTGELLWEFNQSFSHGKVTYFVWDEMVYVGTQDGYVFALDFENGDEIWKYKASAFPVCFAEESDLLIVISDNNSLFALDQDTGMQQWSLNIETEYLEQDCFNNSPLVEKQDSYIYIVSTDRVVHAINSITGEETWSWYDRRFPSWRPIPLNKPVPFIGPIEKDRIYIHNGNFLSDGLFALNVSK